MKTWWLLLMTRSRRDSATTGLGNNGYQSCGALLEVKISEAPARSVISSYRSSAWAGVSSRIAKSSRISTAGRASSPSRLLLEPGPAQPAGDGGGLAAGDLVLAQDLEELDVAEFPGPGLGQAGVDGVEHARQLQRPQCPLQRAGLDDGGRHGVNLRCAVMADARSAAGRPGGSRRAGRRSAPRCTRGPGPG